MLVLDNCSDDGSVAAVEASAHDARVIALDRRTGKAENDSTLLREARGRYCLLLNEDSELREGATAALLEALEAEPARRRGRRPAAVQRGRAQGVRLAAARAWPWRWRRALFLHRLFTVQSRGRRTRRVGWTQSSAMLVRREAAAAVGLPRSRTSSSTPTRPTSASACTTPAGRCSTCRGARGRAPRPAHHRPRRPRAADRGVPPQPRPLHAKAPQRRPSATSCARSASGSTSCWRRRRSRRPGPRPGPLSPARPPGADARARRGNPRGGRGVQPPARESLPRIRPPVEHPDLAQFAAVVAAAGAVLLLAGRGRVQVLAGLALLGAGELLLAVSRSPARTSSTRSPPPSGAAAAVAAGVRARGARRGGRPAARVGAPRRAGGRPAPAARSRSSPAAASRSRWPTTASSGGCCRSTSCSRPARSRSRGGCCGRIPAPRRALPRVIAYPAAAFIAFACLSLTWADRLAPAAELLTYFTMPFALLLGGGRRGRPSPTGRRARWRGWASALASCSRRSASTRRPRASCSSSPRTWRCRTPTPTTSGSPRCSATPASTAAMWCWRWGSCSWCWRCGGSTCGSGSRCWS